MAAKAIKCSRIGGRIVLVGVLTGLSGQVPTVALMSRQQTPHGKRWQQNSSKRNDRRPEHDGPAARDRRCVSL